MGLVGQRVLCCGTCDGQDQREDKGADWYRVEIWVTVAPVRLVQAVQGMLDWKKRDGADDIVGLFPSVRVLRRVVLEDERGDPVQQGL